MILAAAVAAAVVLTAAFAAWTAVSFRRNPAGVVVTRPEVTR
jgi:hypothetical protein